MEREHFGIVPESTEHEPTELHPEVPAREVEAIGKQEEERALFARFEETLNEHLDELVEQGRCPAAWAERKKQAAAELAQINTDPKTLVERTSGTLPVSFFPNANPEAYALQFAEIGLESIRTFQEGVNAFRDRALDEVRPILDRAAAVLAKYDGLEAGQAGNDVYEQVEHLRKFRERLNTGVTEFMAACERIQQIDFDIQEALHPQMQSLEETVSQIDNTLNKLP